MTNTVKQQILPIFIINLFILCGCSEGETGSAKKVIIEHVPPVTVQPAKVLPINESPAFSLRWEKKISGVEDLSFPVGSLHSRVPISNLSSLSREAIEFISFESGEVTGSSKLPAEIASIHKDEGGDSDFSDFSYSLLGKPDDGVLVVSATLYRLYSDGSGSGFATAIYGCSFDGEISWCAKVGLTHNMVATSLRSGEDLLLVEEDDKLLLGITPSGQEAFRVKLPSYNSLVLQRTSSGKLNLLIIGSSISCYEFR